MKTAALILAAGSGSRMGTVGDGQNKTTMTIAGKTPLELCAEAFSDADIIAVVVSDSTIQAAERLKERYSNIRVTTGGKTRQESVMRGLECLDEDTDIVHIHDCARCLVSRELIKRAAEAAMCFGSGIAALKCRDTVRNEQTGEPIDRNALIMAQTPQTFDYKKILSAYGLAFEKGYAATDDCAVYMLAGGTPHYVEGELINQKLTYSGDIPLFERLLGERRDTDMETFKMRIGYGEDTHAFEKGRRLILGGVDIPYEMGLLGHSDADVLVHSIMDALLGAAAKGDIGRHFPDSDAAYKGICSLSLLERVNGILKEEGFAVGNIDATVVAQSPKLAPYTELMRENIAAALGTDKGNISVKATTSEGMNDEGRKMCITVRCVASIVPTASR